MTPRERKGLQMMFNVYQTQLCEMLVDYAKPASMSIHDLDSAWEEVRESLDALLWLERRLKEEAR